MLHRLGVFLESPVMGPSRPGRQTGENNSPVQSDLRDPRDTYVSQSASLRSRSVSYGSFKCFSAPLLDTQSCYYGNTIWAYQDLEPKDILDNNTIAAQPGYLRDLDLRGEIWGVAD
ncbi:Inner kinetochore subunit cnl2 [Dissostichus eleginoides]|uniref:Inner kinetochore subunit cnl2 n=1 Tax=Dissostichus eleginoides TaxID=100907 RepID=A0AAD9CKF8_DISEL|nr:Inner kinetochore subunit cnl2 [Dissostichus eleginoides]